MDIAAAADSLSRRTERQAAALSQTVGAMDELGEAIARNNASARSANALAQSASTVATAGAQADFDRRTMHRGDAPFGLRQDGAAQAPFLPS